MLWYNSDMELSEIYQQNTLVRGNSCTPKISFEVFPPNNGDISNLFEELRVLKRYNPVLVSLAHGTNGGFNRFSVEDMKSIRDLGLNLMPHFICVSMLKNEIEKHIVSVENLGIENVLALRGNIPKYINFQDLDFKYASDLVNFIKEKTTFSIGVAGYPEGHQESKNLKEDIEFLKIKVKNGASAIFTQQFFDNEKFYQYIDAVRGAGINLPIIAGIMPVRNMQQIDEMINLEKVTVPDKFISALKKYPNDIFKIGTEFAIHQCQDLIDFGVDGLHFYTLNHSDQTAEVLENIL